MKFAKASIFSWSRFHVNHHKYHDKMFYKSYLGTCMIKKIEIECFVWKIKALKWITVWKQKIVASIWLNRTVISFLLLELYWAIKLSCHWLTKQAFNRFSEMFKFILSKQERLIRKKKNDQTYYQSALIWNTFFTILKLQKQKLRLFNYFWMRRGEALVYLVFSTLDFMLNEWTNCAEKTNFL